MCLKSWFVPTTNLYYGDFIIPMQCLSLRSCTLPHREFMAILWKGSLPPSLPFLQVDSGSFENVALHSRDEQSVLVVSYADLKTCLEKTFAEVLSSSGQQQSSISSSHSSSSTADATRHTLNGHSTAAYQYTTPSSNSWSKGEGSSSLTPSSWQGKRPVIIYLIYIIFTRTLFF